MTGVLVVEDQQVLASALEIAIGTQPDMDCVGTAATIDDALASVAEHRPDVVLMDIQLPGLDGIEGTRQIKAAYPDVTILILTAGATPWPTGRGGRRGRRRFPGQERRVLGHTGRDQEPDARQDGHRGRSDSPGTGGSNGRRACQPLASLPKQPQHGSPRGSKRCSRSWARASTRARSPSGWC